MTTTYGMGAPMIMEGMCSGNQLIGRAIRFSTVSFVTSVDRVLSTRSKGKGRLLMANGAVFKPSQGFDLMVFFTIGIEFGMAQPALIFAFLNDTMRFFLKCQ